MAADLMNLSVLKILRAFLDDPDGDHYGRALISETGVKSGTLYPALAGLEADGLIDGRWEDIDESEAGRRRRRYYRLTGAGAQTARAELARLVAQLAPPAQKVLAPARFKPGLAG